MDNEMWSFACWKAFNNELYAESLAAEQLVDSGIPEFYQFVFRIEDGEAQEYLVEPEEYRTCVRIDKGAQRYLVPLLFAKDMPIKPAETFPCQLKRADKRIWQFVTKPTILSIKGDKGCLSFKQFIDVWNPMQHSNNRHWLLMKMLALAAKYKGLKCCVCAEPQFGKNSNFSIMNYITRDVCRIQKPTLAKFETVLFFNAVVLPDEVTSMKKEDVREIEPALLNIGDNSSEYNKHSIARSHKMNTVDLVQKSIVFTYNRVCDMKDESSFFDYKWASIRAFRSRYPQLLLDGKIENSMPNLNNAQAKELMDRNFEHLRIIAKMFVYWTKHLHEHLHGWDRVKVQVLPARHQTNLEALFDVLDVYSESQTEFDDWCDVVLLAIANYKDMLSGRAYEQGKLVVDGPPDGPMKVAYEDVL